jgi:HEAT repeat protein
MPSTRVGKRFVSTVLVAAATAAALVAAAAAQDASSVRELIAGLKDKDEAVRLKAAKELGKLKEKAKDAIPALTVTASKDEDEDVRAVAKRSLEAIKDAVERLDKDKVRDVLDPLVKDLKGKDAEKRIAALDKLADLGTKAKDAGADVVEFGVLSPSPGIRAAATAALEKIDPDAHKLIVTALFDNREFNRLEAIERLGALGRKGKSGLPALKHYYRQQISGEGTAGAQGAGAALQATTKIAPDDKEVIDTVIGLVVQPLRPSRRVVLPERSLAIRLLPEVKAEKKAKVVALVAALDDPHCRAQAVTALGKMGPDAKDAVAVLTKLKLDPDKEVRDAVAAALDLITE